MSQCAHVCKCNCMWFLSVDTVHASVTGVWFQLPHHASVAGVWFQLVLYIQV